MRGLVIPDLGEDFTADPVELYFDLAFVFAFSQLVAFLVHEHSIVGIWKGLLLFLMMWFPWTTFTWAANAISSGSRVARGLFLVATVATIPMAASVQAAFGSGGKAFAIGWAVIMLMALGGYLTGIETGSEVWKSMVKLSIPSLVALVIVLVGGFVDGDARIILWVLASVIMAGATIRAGRSEWIVRVGHFAERHALIVIVALGEVIVAVGIPVVRSLTTEEGAQGLPNESIVALVASGAFAALLWWAYFDRAAPALEHKADEQSGIRRGNYARDVYSYSHAPIVLGIILSAAALEEITLHPSDTLPSAFRWMFAIGLLGFLGGVGIAVYRAYGIFAKERLSAAAVLIVLFAAGSSIDGIYLILLVDLILLVTLISEHLRIEGPTHEHASA